MNLEADTRQWANQAPLGPRTETQPLPGCTFSSRAFHTDAPSPCPVSRHSLKLGVTTAIMQIEKQLGQVTPGSEVSSILASLGLAPRPVPQLPCRHEFVYACGLKPSLVPTGGQAQIADMHMTAYLIVP